MTALKVRKKKYAFYLFILINTNSKHRGEFFYSKDTIIKVLIVDLNKVDLTVRSFPWFFRKRVNTG